MSEFTNHTVAAFLDGVGAKTPTPGGGGVTGLCGALGCALAGMVAAYSVRKDTEAASRERIDAAAARFARADRLCRALVDQDAVAYEAMTRAGKATRSAPDDAVAAGVYQDAVLSALAVPMEMAAIASDVLTTLDEFTAHASPYLLSDLGIAAVLAEATARAAGYTVRVNVGELVEATAGARIRSSADQIAAHARIRLASIEAFLTAAMKA